MDPDFIATTQTGRQEEAAAYSRFEFEALKRVEELKEIHSEDDARNLAVIEYWYKVEMYRAEKFGKAGVKM
jgi:hypothetical protein